MNDLLIYGSAGGSAAALITLIKFWMDMGATKLKADQAQEKAEQAEKALADFRAMVAREYASMQALANSEGRLASAVEGIRADFRGMTERIDRLLGKMSAD
jgi:hypothetical protein